MVSVEWHSCSPGHNIWRIILVLPLSLYFPLLCFTGSIQRSPQHWEVNFTEARLSAQIPVCIVAHPGIIVGLPADTKVQTVNFHNKYSVYQITVNVQIFYYKIMLHTWKNAACASCCCPAALSFSPSGAALFSVSAPQLHLHFPPPKAFHKIGKKKKISSDRWQLTWQTLDSRCLKGFQARARLT